MYCIETHALSYSFSKKEPVLKDIDLQVSEGAIYGFLGPNGAGKTTTMKLVLGLLKKQQGEISIFGKAFESHRNDILKKTGSLIESPSLYAQLTATENLQVLQKIYRCPKSRIAEVLKLTGLENTGKKKAGSFSLGMKQRLSIAIALLHGPSLIILDEPTNGLDPTGIIEMRGLLKRLNQEQGITILVSSHLLPEIEKLVTHVGLIHQGRMRFQGTLAELMSRQQLSSTTVFDTQNNAGAFEIAAALAPGAMLVQERLIVPAAAKETVAGINRALLLAGIDVYGISSRQNDLESVFIDLTT